MKYLRILVLLIVLSLSIRVKAQGPIYLPIIIKEGEAKQIMEYPILNISNGTDTINLLDPGSGIQLENPYWQPNIAQLKGGGTFVNPSNADGQSLVASSYDNVIETIPLRIVGPEGYKTVEHLRKLFQLSTNAQNYYTQSFEQNQVYMAVKAKGDNFLTGYAAVYTMSISNISNPFGAPFVNDIDYNQFDTVNLIINREPFFSPLPPGQIIGPLYNLIKNPDFELWNFGITDSQPDSWDDLEDGVTGSNNAYNNPKWGNHALHVYVTESVGAGEFKGVTQIIEDTEDDTEYTVIAWVKNDGITKGVGRILVNYSSQLVLYSSATRHNWTLYTGKITTSVSDIISINCEILTTDSHAIGSVYFDGLMLIKGDWEEEAKNNLLPYMSGSHIVNHLDIEPGIINEGDINYIDGFNVPGDITSLVRVEVVNNTEPADVNNVDEKIAYLRIGMIRNRDLQLFDNYYDSIGDDDNSSSSDNSIRYTPSDEWQSIANKQISYRNAARENLDRYRLFARVKDEGTQANLYFRGKYYIGTAGIHDTVLSKIDFPILNQWSMLDLTKYETIDFDEKVNIPGQIGYNIEAYRETGTDTLQFDYSILMPTNGGFFNISADVPLLYKQGIVVDNTKSEHFTTSFTKTVGWEFYQGIADVDTINGTTRTIVSYNGFLYIVAYDSVGGSYVIVKTRPGLDNVIYPSVHGGYIIIFNNTPYLLQIGTSTVREIQNDDWPGTLVLTIPVINTVPVFMPWNVANYKNKIYMCGYEIDVGVTAYGILYSFDGVNGNLEANVINTTFSNMVVYKDKLYLGTTAVPVGTTPGFYEFDGDTGILTTITTGDKLVPAVAFNDLLYVVNADTGDIYSFDGVNFFLKATGTELNGVGGALIYNGVAYISSLTRTYASEDGEVWTKVNGDIAIGAIYNNLLIGSDNGTPELNYLVNEDSAYNVTNFEGNGFYPPNRIPGNENRHRYFFNWDRPGRINNIDDKALIGIGYRPQYFSLIQKDDF